MRRMVVGLDRALGSRVRDEFRYFARCETYTILSTNYSSNIRLPLNGSYTSRAGEEGFRCKRSAAAFSAAFRSANGTTATQPHAPRGIKIAMFLRSEG